MSAEPIRIRCSTERGMPLEDCALPFEVYQDSSGGMNWNSSNHVNRLGAIPQTFRGYRLRSGESASEGLRATPIVAVNAGDAQLTVAMRQFWENFPKAMEVDGRALMVRLFPGQFGDLHELQGGEQKTEIIHLAFGHDGITETPLEWGRTPLFACATPAWYCRSGAVPYLVPAAEDPHEAYLHLVNQAIEGVHAFTQKREIIDEYGWRHFGDLYADHEAVFHTAGPPFISHYNNQYDAVAGCAVHFFRTGDRRWRDLMRDLAAHVVDIDTYHTTADKSAYNGGLFWHTYHYVDAGRSTHRGYPKAPGVHGGGPSAEHDYSTGLMLEYFLSGDSRYREAVAELGGWVLNMDDGSRTVFRWIASSETGVASASGSDTYHGPGRGAAYSILTLLNAHQLTGRPEFLVKAEMLIRRCIHPEDDIERRNLADVERRWFYTVFLQAIGRYLDFKADRGELDFMYAYARESLLRYSRWMTEHEYPYLEKPEILEYPNETWAAQDMRKSDVFAFAALHSGGDERSKYCERSAFFFDSSVNQLARSGTSALTRPVVLLLGNGFMRAWFERHSEARRPAPQGGGHRFGAPRDFVTQKARARRRLARLALAGGIGLLAAAIWQLALVL